MTLAVWMPTVFWSEGGLTADLFTDQPAIQL